MKTFPLPSVLLVLAAILTGGPGPLRAAEKNIVLVVADDLSPDAGCYGNTAIRTPHMDALAADGVLFPLAFATTASCSASRSVILSGLQNHANGQYGHQHHFHKFSSYPWVRGLPVLLEEGGYRTARIGKFHVAPEESYRFGTVLRGDARNAVQMARNARAFLREESDRPFFLYFATADPHRGGGPADELPLAPDRFGNLPSGGSRPGVEESFYRPEEVVVPPFLPDTPACRAELSQYYQSASRVDQGIGALVSILREAGLYEDTLIVVTSDHGMAFPGAKTTVYEAGLRVPLIVRNPYDNRPGSRNPALVSLVDLTPTLLDFAGLLRQEMRSRGLAGGKWEGERAYNQDVRQAEYRFHGRSFLPVLTNAEPGGWDTILASHTFHEIQMYYPMRVIRDREYKLIWNIAHPLPFPFASDLWAASTWQQQYRQGPDAPFGFRTVASYIHRPAFELFAIGKDPDERHNLAGDPEHAEVLRRYQEKLKTAQESTGDPWMLKWQYE